MRDMQQWGQPDPSAIAGSSAINGVGQVSALALLPALWDVYSIFIARVSHLLNNTRHYYGRTRPVQPQTLTQLGDGPRSAYISL